MMIQCFALCRRTFSLLLVALILSLTNVLTMKAAQEVVVPNSDGIRLIYQYDDESNDCMLVGVSELNEKTAVRIPASVMVGGRKMSVTKIGRRAFANQWNLVDVTIPETVTEIQMEAFGGCGITEIVIPDGVVTIEDEAFCGCCLSYVKIGRSVRWIGLYAFAIIDPIESIEIPSSQWIFDLQSQNCVLSFARHLLIDGKEVVDLEIPEGITCIKDYVLTDCKFLQSVHIPSSVARIQPNAFQGCDNLQKAVYDNLEQLFTIEYEGPYSNPLTLAHHLYVGDKEIVEIEVPQGVTSIGDYALSGCHSLQSVTVTGQVKCIGKNAFKNCESLLRLTLNEGLETIKESAFGGCGQLKSLVIPSTVSSIEGGVFSSSKLRSVLVLCPNPPAIASNSFSGQSFYHTTLYVPVGSYEDYAYDDTSWYRFVSIKECVTDPTVYLSQQVCSLKEMCDGQFLVYDMYNDGIGFVPEDYGIDETRPANNWQIIGLGEGQTYLYNLGAGRFLSIGADGIMNLSQKACPVEVSRNGDGSLQIGNHGSWLLVKNEGLSPISPDDIHTISADDTSRTDSYDLFGRKRNASSSHGFIMSGQCKTFVQ